MKEKYFDNYPVWIVLVTNLVSLSVYLTGLYLLSRLYPLLALFYLLYLLYLEMTFYKEGCSCCCYYNEVCAFGKGKIAPLFFKKDDPKKFCQKELNFKKLLPQMLVSLIPVVAGIILMTQSFSWCVLALTIWPLVVNFGGNPIIYGKLACCHCKQGQICCPACNFFFKKKIKTKQ